MPIIATYNPDEPTGLEKRLLMSLVFTSKLDQEEREEMMNRVNNCTDYKEFEWLQYQLEAFQKTIHEVNTPSYKEIWDHIKKITR